MNLPEGTYVVESVEKLKDIGGGTSIVEIGFEKYPDSKVVMFGDYSESLQFLNQEVIVSFRQEVVDGEIRQCANSMSILTKVNTLDREEDIKLFINDLPDTGSTVDFEDIQLGDYVVSAIVYCNYQIFDSSSKASWAELTIQDKRRHSAKVKLFDPDKKTVNLVGKYVKMDIKRNKFGFNTTDIEPVEGIKISPNPEIELSKRFILQATNSDQLLKDYMEKSKILTYLSSYNDESEPEVGYMVVRVAMEMSQAREFHNTSPIVDVQLLLRGILLNRGYCLAKQEDNMKSFNIQNIINTSAYGSKLMNEKVLTMLEDKPRYDLLEWHLYHGIRESVDKLIRARKFRSFVLSSDKRWR